MSGLYIHIPFCGNKCAYCDFYSLPKHEKDFGRYLDALSEELAVRRQEVPSPFSTIYIGGGTPSILGVHGLDKLFEMLRNEHPAEFTIEVNPEHIDTEFARFLANSPVNRVSMGVQSFVDTELQAISRRHTARGAADAVQRLRDAGIANISIDLIFGLPGQTAESWEYTLSAASALRPEHISAYSLMYEPGTRLTAMLKAGKLKEPPQELSDEMYHILTSHLKEQGYVHYEISNYALPGYKSRHNSSYWDLTPYLGIGASAHSFDGNVRRYNPPDLRKYMNNPTYSSVTEPADESSRINEYLLVRLRTAEGLSISDFGNRFGDDAAHEMLACARGDLSRGTLHRDEDTLRIPEEHWLIADSVIVDLFV